MLSPWVECFERRQGMSSKIDESRSEENAIPAIMQLPKYQQEKILLTEKKLAVLDHTWRCWVYDQVSRKGGAAKTDPATGKAAPGEPFALSVPSQISVKDLKVK